ncbi:hypothetical protein GP486_003550 [Trichoglossum hirsutum]|uniref:HTH APSES-type domain-containing protein n=1 Tax=Trichoglossum hirsutum TaxID=265104 RepID=A0A9P8LD05_9PEZI|nr:hypothetical protein GP486_003550 [Trichoglossum hirsutum]
MASTIRAAPPPHPPSFSRDNTSSSLNGFLASSAVGSFDNTASITSTPTATPPPSRGQQQQYYYNNASQGRGSGGAMQQGSFRSYSEVNGSAQGHGPQIYTAVYSGVSVYEMSVNNVAVMRRRSDSWLNATQILKVAGIDKGKRTKVLEKEILTGDHEKVQGGYGKYQGTWIKYERGVEFCRQYGVEDILKPLLEYDMGNDGVGGAGQGGVETPTKEQAMAAQRKRLYNSGLENRPNGQSSNGTFFKNISSTASNAVAAISKARFDSPGPRVASGTHRPGSSMKMSQHQLQIGSQESAFPGGSQQSAVSQNSFGGEVAADSAYGTQSGVYITAGIQEQARNGDMQEPPRKRMRTSPSRTSSFLVDGSGDYSMREETPTEPNESFYNSQQLSQPLKPEDEVMMALPPLSHPGGKEGERKQQLLGSACVHEGDFSEHPCFLELSGEDLDIPLDHSGHTTLHWAATLAVLPLLKALVVGGASISRVNNGGETALMRAVSATNNFDRGSFPEVLELLGPTIEIRDARGRTVLHHIAVSSAIKGRSAASRYYLESLLEFVVRQGSAPGSQQGSFNAGAIGASSASIAIGGVKAISLGRFMSEIVNARDKSGDTALNIAARIGNRSIIQQLQEVGADPGIPNRAGLRPVDFGIGEEAKANGESTRGNPLAGREILRRGEVSAAVGETSKEIMSSISSLLAQTENDFAEEMGTKQDLIDATHSQLRECSGQLGEERRKLQALQTRASEKTERRHKIYNLRRALEDQRAGVANGDSAQNLKLGDADVESIKALELPRELIESEIVNQNSLGQLDQKQFACISSLPSSGTLRAQLAAYIQNNNALKEYSAQLRSRSRELEEKYRRVVALCTGIKEEEVEETLPGLVIAIESEGTSAVELARVNEIVRRYEGTDA